MDEGFAKRLQRALGSDGISRSLEGLSGTDLQSLLLELFDARAAGQDGASLERRYRESRFLRPSPVPPARMRQLDAIAFRQAEAAGFDELELSPLSPLGVCSVLGRLSQKIAVSTTRMNEVCSDPTNVLALECAVRRRAIGSERPRSTERVRLCTSQRVVRAQFFDVPGAWAHFRLFALCTAGRDEGSLRFETSTLCEHAAFHIELLRAARAAGFGVARIEFRVTCLDERHRAVLAAEVLEPARARFADIDVAFDDERTAGRDYYRRACFQVNAESATGEHLALADGGFTDWTSQLLGNAKERLLISGFGSERFCDRAAPSVP